MMQWKTSHDLWDWFVCGAEKTLRDKAQLHAQLDMADACSADMKKRDEQFCNAEKWKLEKVTWDLLRDAQRMRSPALTRQLCTAVLCCQNCIGTAAAYCWKMAPSARCNRMRVSLIPDYCGHEDCNHLRRSCAYVPRGQFFECPFEV
jgi:hypothetical protein